MLIFLNRFLQKLFHGFLKNPLGNFSSLFFLKLLQSSFTSLLFFLGIEGVSQEVFSEILLGIFQGIYAGIASKIEIASRIFIRVFLLKVNEGFYKSVLKEFIDTILLGFLENSFKNFAVIL